MTEATTPSTILTFGPHSVDFLKLPPVSQFALAKRGWQHVLGNEASSKVSTAKAKRRDEIAAAQAKGEPAPAEYTDEECSAMLAEHVANAFKNITEGTIGQGRAPSGPRQDPVEQVMRRIAVAELQSILKAQVTNENPKGLSLPTGEKVVTFANGKSFTREQLVTLRMNSPKEGPRIRELAMKEIKARDRAAQAAAKQAEGQDLSELLGL